MARSDSLVCQELSKDEASALDRGLFRDAGARRARKRRAMTDRTSSDDARATLRPGSAHGQIGRNLSLDLPITGLQRPDREKTDKPSISKDAYVIGSNLESLTLVGGLPGAIGYVSVGTARALAAAGLPVKVLTLDGVEPSDAAIRDRHYPIVRPLHLVYREATLTMSAFLALALSPQGQDVVKSLGFLTVGDR